jgi:hypothetical protein
MTCFVADDRTEPSNAPARAGYGQLQRSPADASLTVDLMIGMFVGGPNDEKGSFLDDSWATTGPRRTPPSPTEPYGTAGMCPPYMLSGLDADVAQFARLFDGRADGDHAPFGWGGMGGHGGPPAENLPRPLRPPQQVASCDDRYRTPVAAATSPRLP